MTSWGCSQFSTFGSLSQAKLHCLACSLVLHLVKCSRSGNCSAILCCSICSDFFPTRVAILNPKPLPFWYLANLPLQKGTSCFNIQAMLILNFSSHPVNTHNLN